jgi:hypothetical protein
VPETKTDDGDFESVSKMADRLKLKGKDREDYIHDHMTGLGYKARRTYFKGDDDDDGGKRRSWAGKRQNDDDW